MQSEPQPPVFPRARVALVVFEEEDLAALLPAEEVLDGFGIAFQRAHLGDGARGIPDLAGFARETAASGVQVVIAATRAVPETRALAAAWAAPVIRVPVAGDGSPAAALAALTGGAEGGEALRETEPRPGAFATVALGEAGARNAALLAVSILALSDERLRVAWQAFRERQTNAVLAQPPPAG